MRPNAALNTSNMANKYRLNFQALKLSPVHYHHDLKSGKTFCLGCTGPVKKVIPTSQTGKPPIEVTIYPATDAQWKMLVDQNHPLIESYDEAEEAAAARAFVTPPAERQPEPVDKSGKDNKK